MKQSDSRRAAIVSILNEYVVTILGLESGTQIDPKRSLEVVGIDSLLGMDLTTMIEKRLAVSIPEDTVSDYPTLELLAGRLDELGVSVPRSEDSG